MDVITSQLTNRDIAFLVWLGVFIGFLLVLLVVKRDIRQPLGTILRLLFWSKLTWFLLALMAYAALIIIGGYAVGAWQPWMLKDTLYWFFGTALITFFNINKASTEEHFFRNELVGNLQFATLLAFVVNLYVFNLVVELLLLPFLALLAMLLVVANTKEEYAPVKKFLRGVSGLIGLAILAYAGFQVFRNPQGLISVHNLQDLLLPPVLTLLLLPFFYAVAVFSAYELLYVRLKVFGRDHDPRLARFALWQVVRSCRWRLSYLRQFTNRFAARVGTAGTRDEILTIMAEFQAAVHDHRL